jgi:hypothetical protein
MMSTRGGPLVGAFFRAFEAVLCRSEGTVFFLNMLGWVRVGYGGVEGVGGGLGLPELARIGTRIG